MNGVAFDANAQTAVKAVKSATNQVELLNALKSAYFTGVNSDLIVEYFGDADRGNVATVKDVQDIIDKVNKANVAQTNVKAVQEANNQVQLLSALQKFERVNADLIAQYAAGTTSKAGIKVNAAGTDNVIYTNNSSAIGTNAVAVQAAIDAVNVNVATDAVTAADTTTTTALTADSISEAQALVNALPSETVAEKATKKALQDRFDKASAVSKVKNATTQASLLSALKSPVLNLQNIDDSLAKFYKSKQSTATINAVTADLQGDIITAGKTAAIAELNTNLEAVKADTPLSEVKALLTELKRLDGANLTSKINDALLEDYRTGLVAATITDTASVDFVISTANTNTTELSAVANYSGSDADALLLLLQNNKLALDNVMASNKDAYLADLALIKTAAGTSVAAVQEKVNLINSKVALNAATTDSEAASALTKFAIGANNTGYINLNSTGKLEVAAMVLKAMPDGGYVTNGNVTTAINDGVSARGTLIGNVNTASDISTMNTRLVALTYKPFTDLTASQKVAVAEAFLANFPTDKDGVKVAYTTLTNIKADIDKAITAVAE